MPKSLHMSYSLDHNPWCVIFWEFAEMMKGQKKTSLTTLIPYDLRLCLKCFYSTGLSVYSLSYFLLWSQLGGQSLGSFGILRKPPQHVAVMALSSLLADFFPLKHMVFPQLNIFILQWSPKSHPYLNPSLLTLTLCSFTSQWSLAKKLQLCLLICNDYNQFFGSAFVSYFYIILPFFKMMF